MLSHTVTLVLQLGNMFLLHARCGYFTLVIGLHMYRAHDAVLEEPFGKVIIFYFVSGLIAGT